jgi:signal transduction histidine kinase
LNSRLSLALCLIFLAIAPPGKGTDTKPDPTWLEAKQKGKAIITAYWHESRPFVYKNALGKMEGIEYEMLIGFQNFVRKKKGVDLTIVWKEGQSFSDTYTTVRDRKAGVTFGSSAFSITTKRDQEVDFTPPYMSDISVLITSDNIPILKSFDEFNALMPKLTAITIKETTYEQELMRLKQDGNLPFKFQYIPSSKNIMRTIAETDSTFGFIDLPVYMLLFNENPSIHVKRQNLFPVRREGYGLIMPEQCDWSQPFKEYFENESFKTDLEEIISRYIDLDLYRFVESLALQSDDQMISLLTKEKEIQYKDLLGKTQQVIDETRKRNFLIVLMSVTLVFLVMTAVQYRKRNEQRDQIEEQRKNIEVKSVQLELRNKHLLALDDEKNNLIKILAHDLRTPINQIHGLAQLVLLENTSMQDDQKSLVRQITDTSVRLNKMITHLLDIDALENNRVTVFSENVNITALVQKAVNSFEKQALKKNITLSFDSLCDHCVVKGDSLFLIQIMENLISNAIKFSEKGKPVAISLRENQGRILISVKDQGPGLTEDDMQNLFKKFQRLSARPTSDESSFGLGLSIVKKYVEMMDGKVWCESDFGNGATFFLEFQKSDH